jgi:SAGA-associated factor 73
MGAKRAVTGRSRGYDELLLEWNRAHNPNFVEPVKRETKAEKKEKKDREKAEKKRLAAEAAAAAGESTTAAPGAAKKSEGGPAKSKKKKTATAANAGAGPAAAAQAAHKDSDDEDLAGIDSDEEMESLIRAVHAGTSRGLVGQPLALPNDVSPWFVVRRERLRNCHQHISQALNFSNLGGLGQSRPGLLASTTRLA